MQFALLWQRFEPFVHSLTSNHIIVKANISAYYVSSVTRVEVRPWWHVKGAADLEQALCAKEHTFVSSFVY